VKPLRSTSQPICIVGGAGHVGLPLALTLANSGAHVCILDVDIETMELIQRGTMPFREEGAQELLLAALASGRLEFTSSYAAVAAAKTVIVTIGTPIDEFMNPTIRRLARCFEDMLPYLHDEQLLVMRSTVYPGVTEWLDAFLDDRGVRPRLAFCPERIVQGYAIRELSSLPQIVSGTSAEAIALAAELFEAIAPEIVYLEPRESEFVKLFSNAYRYIQFAISNQFYMIAASSGVDYQRVLYGMKHNYPRMRDVPSAGFAAGPCLFKDTMQLSAFYDNQFSLGHAAMLVNEGLPLYVVDQLARDVDLGRTTVGLLGMAFKANSDDRRSSLAYKLKKMLSFRAHRVLTTDPHVRDDQELLPLDEVLTASEVLILCVPHDEYRMLSLDNKRVVDVWNYLRHASMTDCPAMTGSERVSLPT
jgi:UDP-N-acetyl-D-mannosaminuronic acid dehydrogenase